MKGPFLSSLCPCPQVAYELAARAMANKSRALGAEKAAALYGPRRLYGGWWSPLTGTVLLVAGVPRA